MRRSSFAIQHACDGLSAATAAALLNGDRSLIRAIFSEAKTLHARRNMLAMGTIRDEEEHDTEEAMAALDAARTPRERLRAAMLDVRAGAAKVLYAQRLINLLHLRDPRSSPPKPTLSRQESSTLSETITRSFSSRPSSSAPSCRGSHRTTRTGVENEKECLEKEMECLEDIKNGFEDGKKWIDAHDELRHICEAVFQDNSIQTEALLSSLDEAAKSVQELHEAMTECHRRASNLATLHSSIDTETTNSLMRATEALKPYKDALQKRGIALGQVPDGTTEDKDEEQMESNALSRTGNDAVALDDKKHLQHGAGAVLGKVENLRHKAVEKLATLRLRLRVVCRMNKLVQRRRSEDHESESDSRGGKVELQQTDSMRRTNLYSRRPSGLLNTDTEMDPVCLSPLRSRRQSLQQSSADKEESTKPVHMDAFLCMLEEVMCNHLEQELSAPRLQNESGSTAANRVAAVNKMAPITEILSERLSMVGPEATSARTAATSCHGANVMQAQSSQYQVADTSTSSIPPTSRRMPLQCSTNTDVGSGRLFPNKKTPSTGSRSSPSSSPIRLEPLEIQCDPDEEPIIGSSTPTCSLLPLELPCVSTPSGRDPGTATSGQSRNCANRHGNNKGENAHSMLTHVEDMQRWRKVLKHAKENALCIEAVMAERFDRKGIIKSVRLKPVNVRVHRHAASAPVSPGSRSQWEATVREVFESPSNRANHMPALRRTLSPEETNQLAVGVQVSATSPRGSCHVLPVVARRPTAGFPKPLLSL